MDKSESAFEEACSSEYAAFSSSDCEKTGTSGSRIWKQAPLGLFRWAVIVPPMTLMMLRALQRPRPEPDFSGTLAPR